MIIKICKPCTTLSYQWGVKSNSIINHATKLPKWLQTFNANRSPVQWILALEGEYLKDCWHWQLKMTQTINVYCSMHVSSSAGCWISGAVIFWSIISVLPDSLFHFGLSKEP